MEDIPDQVERSVPAGLVAESADFVASLVLSATQSHNFCPLSPLRNFVPPQLVNMIWPRVHSVRLE